MSVRYKVVQCDNPQGEKGKKYYRPRVVKTDDYTHKELMRDVNDATGVSDVDVNSVLFAISKQIRKALLAGRTVVLKDVGRISVGMTTRCIPEDELNDAKFRPSDYIEGVHINFRPDADIANELRELSNLRCVQKRPPNHTI